MILLTAVSCFMNLSWNMRHRKFLYDWFMNLFVPNHEPFTIVRTKISVFVRLKKKSDNLRKGSSKPHESIIKNFQCAFFTNHGWVYTEPFNNSNHVQQKGSSKPHKSIIRNFQCAFFMNHWWVYTEPFNKFQPCSTKNWNLHLFTSLGRAYNEPFD